MTFTSQIFFFLTIACVYCETEAPFEPCNTSDLVCLRTASNHIISRVFDDSSRSGFDAINPLYIAVTDVYTDENMGLIFHFKNTYVSGLRNLKLVGFKLDTEKKTATLQINSEINVVSDVDVDFTKFSKTFHGRYSASANVTTTLVYGYTLKDVGGTEYFELGSETNTCNFAEDPKVTLKVELHDDTDKDAFRMQPVWDKAALRKITLCQIVDGVSAALMKNLRETAKIFPKTTFFKDI